MGWTDRCCLRLYGTMPSEITVVFKQQEARAPVARSCSRLLELDSRYSDIDVFREEFLAILRSKIEEEPLRQYQFLAEYNDKYRDFLLFFRGRGIEQMEDNLTSADPLMDPQNTVFCSWNFYGSQLLFIFLCGFSVSIYLSVCGFSPVLVRFEAAQGVVQGTKREEKGNEQMLIHSRVPL